MREDHVIVGVHVTDRAKEAVRVQEILTDFGCDIKTRIGLHEIHDSYCSPAGLIVLEVISGEERADSLISELSAVEGVEIRKMVFGH